MKKFVKPVAKPEQVPSMNPPPMPVKAARPPAVPPVSPKIPAGPSPMARPPVPKTSRQVPSVPTARGVVRTDTHNQVNQVPAHAKHKGRGV
jgi:hypothetical protein